MLSRQELRKVRQNAALVRNLLQAAGLHLLMEAVPTEDGLQLQLKPSRGTKLQQPGDVAVSSMVRAVRNKESAANALGQRRQFQPDAALYGADSRRASVRAAGRRVFCKPAPGPASAWSAGGRSRRLRTGSMLSSGDGLGRRRLRQPGRTAAGHVARQLRGAAAAAYSSD